MAVPAVSVCCFEIKNSTNTTQWKRHKQNYNTNAKYTWSDLLAFLVCIYCYKHFRTKSIVKNVHLRRTNAMGFSRKKTWGFLHEISCVFFYEKSKIKKRWAANAGRCFLFGPLDHPYGLVSTYGSLLGVIFLMMKKLRPWSLRQQQIGRTRLGRNGGNKTPSHLGQKMHQNAIFWSFKVKFLGVYLFFL